MKRTTLSLWIATGIEGFFGDMDFKVAGTIDSITSIQVDIKSTACPTT